MTGNAGARGFLRLVLVVSILANAGAASVVQGERVLQPFGVASSLDRYRHRLTDDVAAYGRTIQALHDRIDHEAAP